MLARIAAPWTRCPARRAAGCGLVLAFLWCAGPPAPAAAQEAGAAVNAVVLGDLTVARVRHLDFGTLVSNSGQHTVSRESESAGLFRIVGDWNKIVNFTISRPSELVHETPDVPGEPATIPLTLNVTYTPRAQGGSGNIDACVDYQTLVGTSGSTRLRCQPANQGLGNDRALSRVWIWGTIDVGDVPGGRYSAQVIVTAEYN